MKIRFSSAFLSITKEREVELEIDEISVRDMIEELGKKYGEEFKNRLLEDGQLRRFVNVYINGEDIRHLDGLDTVIRKGDEVSILPAVSGG